MLYPNVVLKKGSVGEEVKYIKDCLFSLGYLKVKPVKKNFGSDTEKAVKDFQKENKDVNGKSLDVDGKVGQLTWGSIIKRMENSSPAPSVPNPPNLPIPPVNDLLNQNDFKKITPTNLRLINDALKGVSKERFTFVKFILQFAYDVDYTKDNLPSALYIYGANLVDTNLKIQLANESGFIDAKAKRNPQYFDGGRLDWMKRMASTYPALAASDCSGMIVGFLRLFKYESKSFDTTANGFCGSGYSSQTTRAKMVPGDFVGFNGHIGVYAGGNLVIEFAGGNYGCQLTNLTNRKLKNLRSGKIESAKQWTKFRTPKWFK